VTSISGLKLRPNAKPRVLSGHPWVFANEVEALLSPDHDGRVVECRDRTGRFLGSGIYNSKSQIVWRRLSREKVDLDEAYVTRAIQAAVARRSQSATALPPTPVIALAAATRPPTRTPIFPTPTSTPTETLAVLQIGAGAQIVNIEGSVLRGRKQPNLKAVATARQAGLHVRCALVIVDRKEQEGRAKVEADGVKVISLLTIDDLTAMYGHTAS